MLHTYVLWVQYSCGIVLVFWFWREIVFGITYYTYLVLRVQYSCAVVSVFLLWREIVLKMRTPFDFLWAFSTKNLIGLLYYDLLANVYVLSDLTLFYSVSFYSVSFSCTAQINKLKFKSEYYLRINMWNCVKMQTPAITLWFSEQCLLGFFILEKQLVSQDMFLIKSKLSIIAYLFLVLYRSTSLQSLSFLKNMETFLCK